MAFPDAGVAQLLADTKRHCCVCYRWCGFRLHLHHIQPRAEGGPDTIENAIPVCLDCHAEIESRSNMGRHFSQAELREHKRRWLELCRDHPEILVAAGRNTASSGPLEALLSELQFNAVLLTGDDHRHDYAVLANSQFDRAIAANALASRHTTTRDQVFRVYRGISATSDMIRARMTQPPGGNSYNELSNHIRDRRVALRPLVVNAIQGLQGALGGTADTN